MAYLAKMAEIAINRQIVNKSSNENLASNLNICRILNIASPLAIFRCLCQTRGQVIFRHLCQIRHFCQNRHSPWGHFWHPVWIASLLEFFAILGIACISGHKWVWVPGIQTVTCRSAVKRSTDWANPAAVKFIEIRSKVGKKDQLLMERSIYESFTAEVLAQSVERVIACSRFRDSRVRWIEKAQTRK